MSRESAREKGLRYLVEARVRILECHEDDGTLSADVRGEGASYAVTHDQDGWTCDCRARSEGCAHIYALRQVVVFAPPEPRP